MQPNCRSSLGRNRQACFVLGNLDQRLAVAVTFIYQIMQTQVLVAAILAAVPISARYQDKTTRSSQVPEISVLQITRCLDSSSDKTPAEKDRITPSQSSIGWQIQNPKGFTDNASFFKCEHILALED